MVDQVVIEKAKEHFGKLVKEQLERVEQMKHAEGWTDYSKKKGIVIGIVGGDGIGPYICKHARTVLEFLLAEEISSGKVELRTVEGLTIENRAQERGPMA
jgi:isocitrate dehydrogenase (NAD+)